MASISRLYVQESMMFSYQPFATSSFFKESINAQMLFLTAMSKSFFDTSMQIGELSTQAFQNVMEASLANFRQGLQVGTAANAKPFSGQPAQSPSVQLSILQPEPVSTDTAAAVAAVSTSAPPSASEPMASVASDQPAAPAEAITKDAGHAAHESPSKPSPLVEKLIASVVETPNSGDKKSGSGDKKPGNAGK